MSVLIKYNPEVASCDISLNGLDLEGDEGLRSAILLSLFTDRRAKEDDEIPGDTDDPRGWWANELLPHNNDEYGSRLWLLNRRKIGNGRAGNETLRLAENYAEEALSWMVEDGIAVQVSANATPLDHESISIEIQITRPSGTLEAYQYEWSKTIVL